MVVSNIRRTLWLESVLNGVEATVEIFWPLPPGVVTCRFSCEAPKERWNGMLDWGATVLSSRFLDDFSSTHRTGNGVMLPLKEYQGFSLICDQQFVFNVVCLICFPWPVVSIVCYLYLSTSKMRCTMEMKSWTSGRVEAWLDKAARIRTAIETIT
jgi:hypothetical protein